MGAENTHLVPSVFLLAVEKFDPANASNKLSQHLRPSPESIILNFTDEAGSETLPARSAHLNLTAADP